MEWQEPEVGAKVVAEYWLTTPDPSVIKIFKADHIMQLWASLGRSQDFFDISIYPATTAEEGVELLKQMPPP
jgi:hypothetical protein